MMVLAPVIIDALRSAGVPTVLALHPDAICHGLVEQAPLRSVAMVVEQLSYGVVELHGNKSRLSDLVVALVEKRADGGLVPAATPAVPGRNEAGERLLSWHAYDGAHL